MYTKVFVKMLEREVSMHLDCSYYTNEVIYPQDRDIFKPPVRRNSLVVIIVPTRAAI